MLNLGLNEEDLRFKTKQDFSNPNLSNQANNKRYNIYLHKMN